LISDSKNYHAWSYRIWLIDQFGLWDGEFDFVNEKITEDPFNNSAWSYRYFLIAKQKETSVETFSEEIKFALGFINKPDERENEALWVYI
jgi:protein farnesyltransferase/geranylgeranyltransferase type-1 subunit alpha